MRYTYDVMKTVSNNLSDKFGHEWTFAVQGSEDQYAFYYFHKDWNIEEDANIPSLAEHVFDHYADFYLGEEGAITDAVMRCCVNNERRSHILLDNEMLFPILSKDMAQDFYRLIKSNFDLMDTDYHLSFEESSYYAHDAGSLMLHYKDEEDPQGAFPIAQAYSYYLLGHSPLDICYALIGGQVGYRVKDLDGEYSEEKVENLLSYVCPSIVSIHDENAELDRRPHRTKGDLALVFNFLYSYNDENTVYGSPLYYEHLEEMELSEEYVMEELFAKFQKTNPFYFRAFEMENVENFIMLLSIDGESPQLEANTGVSCLFYPDFEQISKEKNEKDNLYFYVYNNSEALGFFAQSEEELIQSAKEAKRMKEMMDQAISDDMGQSNVAYDEENIHKEGNFYQYVDDKFVLLDLNLLAK